MDGEAVHKLVYEIAGQVTDARPAELFQAIYLVLLGKPRGPRAGSFITVDKPPASIWLMALSARIFGFSSWSMLVPQALAEDATQHRSPGSR